jgi:AAA15 family ATPase/GTPase
VIARVTRPNALFLSSAPQFNHKQLVGIIRWFSRFEMIRVDLVTENIRGKIAAKYALPLMLDPEGNKDLLSKLGFNATIIAALKATILKSDVGIHDIRIVEKELLVESKMKLFKNLEFKHDAEDESSWIPLKEESSGTQSLIYLSPLFIRALYYGTTVVVDELESKLHPLLALEIIKAFNDPVTNPRNAQLIFSTHDTNLLGSVLDDTPLRRDQIWLTEKKSTGESVLFPLTEFNARKAENLERGYLQGRYGAVPFLHELLKFEVEQSNEPTGKKS